jgi:uncharacterized protein DUF3168
MTHPASLSLQQAIFTALSTSTALVNYLDGAKIYDDMPEQTPFPYVTIGQSLMTDWSTASDQGREHLLRLHVWSRSTGSSEVQLITEEIINILHDVSLNLTDNVLVNMRFSGVDMLRDRDGKTHHSILRFRAVTEPV